MNFVEYPDRDLMMFALADALASDLNKVLRSADRASLALAGGTTPAPVLDILSGVSLPWDRVTVIPTDERWVGEDDGRSNAAMIRRRLLRSAAEAATFVPLYVDAPEPEAAMDRVAAAVTPHLPLAVALLGMGADMHTASLFPGGSRLADALASDAPAVLPMRAPGAAEPRVTLSARVLRDAMAVHLLIVGADKRRAFEAAQSLPAEQAPVRAVLADATVHWAD